MWSFDGTTPLQNEHVDVQLQEIKKLIIKCQNTRSHTGLTVYKEEKNVNLYNVGGLKTLVWMQHISLWCYDS